MSDHAPINTTSSSASEPWSTKSKKVMLLGFIIVIAGIGSEPFFLSLNQVAGLVSLLIMLIGIYVAILGFLETPLVH